MKKDFADKLNEFLDSECSDFDLSYSWEWIDDCNLCEVTVKRNDHTQFEKIVNFKFDNDGKNLLFELSEDSYYEINEFNYTVKYFWMKISPTLFPND